MATKRENSTFEVGSLNNEQIQEIITAVPSWILRRGITIIFVILLLFVALLAFIRYPDTVKSQLKVNSLNAPKSVYVKQTGKVILLLVKEGMKVKQGDPLAFMESTANHRDVLKLHDELIAINNSLNENGVYKELALKGLNLGELQGIYQNFYQQYLQYISTQNGGYYLNRKQFLKQDLKEIKKLKAQILAQQNIQEKEYANVKQEFEAYQKLFKKAVISRIEYQQQENKFFSGKYPLQETTTALLNNNSTYTNKEKEILDLEHTIQEEKAKFTQALSNMITETNKWLNQYVLQSPVTGIVSYAGIIQENQTVMSNQELFIINPANTDFFGELQIPQNNMGKVRVGQRTLIKMRSYPFEQYGLIIGRIDYLSDVAFKDSVFLAKVNFDKINSVDSNYKIVLKNGMLADAEIITKESSLLKRIFENLIKMMGGN